MLLSARLFRHNTDILWFGQYISSNMMWLKYGVARNGSLLTIEEVSSGKTDLLCPFCLSPLIAKKGKIKQHHFAHLGGQTCLRVKRGQIPSLPLYDNFHLQLSAQHFQLVKQLWREYALCPHPIIHVPFALQLKKLFERVENGYQFTDLGKIPVGGLSLSSFNQIQEPLIIERLTELTNSVAVASDINSVKLQEKLGDLKIYQLQIQRILQLSLYFLEIKADGQTFHKIGVTRRTMGERIPEIERDLKQHYRAISIFVLGTWKHRGNVELYFKHRYKDFNYKIGKLTEYFKFKDIERVKYDLEQMQPKILSDLAEIRFAARELTIYQSSATPVLN